MTAPSAAVEAARQARAQGRAAVVGRVIGLRGFSTLPGDEMVVIDEGGGYAGELLGRTGAATLSDAAGPVLSGRGLATVPVVVHGPAVQELGLACGGRADVLLQPVDAIPDELWDRLAQRVPVGLLTVVDGPDAGPEALAVSPDGRTWGRLPSRGRPEAVAEAVRLLGAGHDARTRVEDAAGAVLVEVWVPQPRMVVVGAGEMVAALEAQAGLLGWEVRATAGAGPDLEALLEWAGAAAALVVLSHDAEADVPALAAGLARGVPYVGAMGSRATQSRRLSRLAESGVAPEQVERIHRPIGLDLGGRRAAEVALAIVAEVLACHHGRTGRPLAERGGPIH